jgi:dextransucrase
MKRRILVSAFGVSALLIGSTVAAGTLPAAAAADPDDVFVSNEELDSHVIFQAFGLFQPDDHDTYTTLAANTDTLVDWGITDLWAPPPYRVASDSKYREGYAIADRYDLGAYGKGPTKYGTADELKAALDALHAVDIRAQVDVVPNQMIGLTQRRVLPVTPVDQYGNEVGPSFLYATYTKGTAPGQTDHGVIKEWDYFHYNGTSSQFQGLHRVLAGEDGQPITYFGPGDPDNHLPEWLATSEAAANNAIKTVDGYVLADSYYALEGSATPDATDDKYVPVLFHYIDPRAGSTLQNYLDYARDNGYSGTDDEVRVQLAALAPADLGTLTDEYIAAQPGYNKLTEPGGVAYRFDGPESDHSDIGVNILDFEFLIGNDLNTQREDVFDEQLNWQRYLLDFGFDGFRIDAASHFNLDLLKAEKEQRLEYFAGEDVNEHLSYIESYVEKQIGFEEDENNNGQLVMDAGPYLNYLNSFGRKQVAVNTVFTSSVNDRVNGYEDPVPNWSFINNHDQEFNVINPIPLTPEEAGDAEKGTFEYEKIQFEKYDADRAQVDKQWAPYNVPVMYAIELTNKDTIPTVFYGDMFKTTGDYFVDKTPYHDDIEKLLKIRKQYAKGDQDVILQPTHSSAELGGDLVSSARLGTSRDTGVAVIAGNFPGANDVIEVEMGPEHANQVFRDAMGYDGDIEVTDDDGTLEISVEGFSNVSVDGYLATYVPMEDAPVLDNVKAPKIDGEKKVGQTLTTDGGTWIIANPELEYQWLRDGQPIENATGASHTLVAEDAGTTITVQVTADHDDYAPDTATSKGVKIKKSKN